jgi:hypothetical protein
MKRTIITAGALAGMLAATPAVADESFTGNQLHKFCTESLEFCIGFAAGVMNGMSIGGWNEPAICLPKAFMTFGQHPT